MATGRVHQALTLVTKRRQVAWLTDGTVGGRRGGAGRTVARGGVARAGPAAAPADVSTRTAVPAARTLGCTGNGQQSCTLSTCTVSARATSGEPGMVNGKDFRQKSPPLPAPHPPPPPPPSFSLPHSTPSLLPIIFAERNEHVALCTRV